MDLGGGDPGRGGDRRGPSIDLTRWVFLRGLALVWLVAFVSLRVQIDGLVGPEGILPAGELLSAIEGQLGPSRFLQAPTLCWITGTGTGALHGLCDAGTVMALLLLAGVAPGAMAAGLWVLYLSLVVAGNLFLSFQWDVLLLETGALAIVFAPWCRFAPRPGDGGPPSRVGLWLVRILLFKLMFLSGVVKLTSHDPTWRDLTALQYHYWTTCLPVWTGWWVHQLPAWFHRASVVGMFAVELAVPFLVFAPLRSLRITAFVAFVALQLGIAATGNYGFFNLLTIVLCVSLLEDRELQRFVPASVRDRLAAREAGRGRPAPRFGPALVLAAVVVPLSFFEISGRLLGPATVPGPVRALASIVAPFRSVNGYGLFASMTTRRREIVVEGSSDGVTWKTYEFRWKPGDPSRRPRFVQPHMPRLDWQMWFAALGDWRRDRWVVRFLERLRDGSGPVVRLLGNDPFDGAPPTMLRAVAWDYRFTTREEKRATGAWWHREEPGLWCPIVR